MQKRFCTATSDRPKHGSITPRETNIRINVATLRLHVLQDITSSTSSHSITVCGDNHLCCHCFYPCYIVTTKMLIVSSPPPQVEPSITFNMDSSLVSHFTELARVASSHLFPAVQLFALHITVLGSDSILSQTIAFV